MNIDDLIADSIGRPGAASQCWARKVTGTAREYLTALEELPVRDVYQVKVVEIFDSLGVEVSAGQVSTHLRRKCKCR